ncbi:hypothetical protein D3870_05510 [Noviherbaspirillum cavernae]|uniref:Bacteriocin n=1 Tax=Noviherbaspirillum cavernae TaxID=2320862 RepID=A0A418WZ73_9BURK|nr:hypothetical protein [Noviherbaspirillum cavernae]RJG05544.1 hypothetical protein D3870_05510 [Noviherbaspirillum cavernae]
MKTLSIKDLAIAEELDAEGMSAVRGGTYKMPKMPYLPDSYGSTSTTNISIDQVNNQAQSNPTGNNSAVFCGNIEAWNNQQGSNSIGGFGYGVK